MYLLLKHMHSSLLSRKKNQEENPLRVLLYSVCFSKIGLHHSPFLQVMPHCFTGLPALFTHNQHDYHLSGLWEHRALTLINVQAMAKFVQQTGTAPLFGVLVHTAKIVVVVALRRCFSEGLSTWSPWRVCACQQPIPWELLQHPSWRVNWQPRVPYWQPR